MAVFFKNKKILLSFIGGIFGIVLVVIGVVSQIHKSKQNDMTCYPQIILKGDKIVSLKIGDNYEESGYELLDSCGENLDKRIQIDNTVQKDVPGTYEIIYTVDNQYGNVTQEKRFVSITVDKDVSYQDRYDNIDNEVHGWGIPNKKDGARPVEAGSFKEKLLKYNAYFIGKDEKTLYLTFDEGQNDTYIDEIVDVLNQNDVKATFFFCKQYILDNPELMKKLVESGHSVGNHTANHYQMPLYANRGGFQKYLNEIFAVEEAFQQVTGTSMDRIYREPKGEYSYRSLQIMKDLGYKTYFWSIAYVDFEGDLTKEQALEEMTSRMHNGAVYLIHPKNKGNYEALDEFIKTMKGQGYTFDLVKNIE